MGFKLLLGSIQGLRGLGLGVWGFRVYLAQGFNMPPSLHMVGASLLCVFFCVLAEAAAFKNQQVFPDPKAVCPEP